MTGRDDPSEQDTCQRGRTPRAPGSRVGGNVGAVNGAMLVAERLAESVGTVVALEVDLLAPALNQSVDCLRGQGLPALATLKKGVIVSRIYHGGQ